MRVVVAVRVTHLATAGKVHGNACRQAAKLQNWAIWQHALGRLNKQGELPGRDPYFTIQMHPMAA